MTLAHTGVVTLQETEKADGKSGIVGSFYAYYVKSVPEETRLAMMAVALRAGELQDKRQSALVEGKNCIERGFNHLTIVDGIKGSYRDY